MILAGIILILVVAFSLPIFFELFSIWESSVEEFFNKED
jgi:hypothetical protein